jgi:rhodanese-related sulfurtransferase
LRDKTDLRLIDVREPDEYEEVHVKGAELFPLSKLRDGERPERDGRPTALICRSGSRSEMAAKMLERDGWEDLINVSDGTIGAVEAGEEHVER